MSRRKRYERAHIYERTVYSRFARIRIHIGASGFRRRRAHVLQDRQVPRSFLWKVDRYTWAMQREPETSVSLHALTKSRNLTEFALLQKWWRCPTVP
jgi:hypothetical protein